MDTDFPTAAPDDTLDDVATMMHDADVTHMPVVDATASSSASSPAATSSGGWPPTT